jgi:S1-C subfamily serine protease
VEDLTPENIRRFRIQEKKGVVVVDVEPNSLTDAAGIIPGDIILEINKQSVKNISDYQKLTRGLKGDALVKTIRGYFLIKEGE